MNGLGGFAGGLAQGFASTWKPELVEKARANAKAEKQRDEKLAAEIDKANKEANIKTKEFQYKIQQDVAKWGKDLGAAKTIPEYNEASKNISMTLQSLGQDRPYEPLERFTVKTTDGKEKEVVALSSLKSMTNLYVAEDGQFVEKYSTFNGDKEESVYQPIGAKDMSSRFKGEGDLLKKSEMVSIIGADGKPTLMTYSEYNALPENQRPELAPTSSSKNIDPNSIFPKEQLSPEEVKLYSERGYQPTYAQINADRKSRGTNGSKRTIQDIKVEQYDKYVSIGGNDTFEMWETKIQEKAKTLSQSKIISDTLNFAKGINKDTYNPEAALEQESLFITTSANNSKIQTAADDFEKSVTIENQTSSLYNEFKTAVENGTYNSGLIVTTQSKIQEYTGESKFSELLGLSPEEQATRLGLDTKMGDAVAKYVKLISGAAATDAERRTLLNIMFGSEFKDENARLTKFTSFIEKMKNDNTETAKTMLKHRPYTAGEYLYGKKQEQQKMQEKQKVAEKQKDVIVNVKDEKTGEIKKWNVTQKKFVD